jgi:hypothetical protein
MAAFVMHWSRLVDAPIAAIMLVAGKLLGNQAAGETVAMVLWPALTFIAALYFIGRAAMRYAGPDALFPAIAIGATSLYTIGVFGPGCIDHHNVQITLTLAMLAFMLDSVDRPGFGLLSGAAAGLMLAVGMETVAYVAVGGLAISLWYLVKGEAAARQAANFGIGLAGSTLTAMLITRPISQWGSVECDALSGAQLAGACIAGIGLAAITSLPSLRNTSARRTFALAGLGVVLGAVVFAAFPQCVAKPYADMPPALRDYFMSGIAEAQSFVAVLKVAPASVFLYYPAALVATGWLGWRIWRNGAQLDDMIVAAFLVPATIVALYQLRGTKFRHPDRHHPAGGHGGAATPEPGRASFARQQHPFDWRLADLFQYSMGGRSSRSHIYDCASNGRRHCCRRPQCGRRMCDTGPIMVSSRLCRRQRWHPGSISARRS